MSTHTPTLCALALALLGFAPATLAQSTGPLRLPGAGWIAPLALAPANTPHTEDTGSLAPGAWTALFVTQLPWAPYRFAGVALDAQWWFDALLAIGVVRGVVAALDVPVLVTQAGSLTAFDEPSASASGLGDVRLAVRWSSRVEPAGAWSPGLAFAAQLAVAAPTGSPGFLAGTGAWSAHPTLVASYAFPAVRLVAQLGYRARLDAHWPAQAGDCAADMDPTPTGAAGVTCLAGVPLRDGVTWSVGLVVPDRVLAHVVELWAEAYGAIDARAPFAPGTAPLELGAGARHRFGELAIGVGASAGITFGVPTPGVPVVRPMVLLAWTPVFGATPRP